MSETKELKEDDLKRIIGGDLTPDAKAWFQKYESVIADRLPRGVGGGLIWLMTMDGTTYKPLNLAEFKALLSEAIDISDLV